MMPVHEPYATWKPELATDEPDGMPDRAIVPLVESLRKRGIVTVQSCAGHYGSGDGCLWVKAESVTAESALQMRGGRSPFSAIRRTRHPEDRWEFEWYPLDVDRAMKALEHLVAVKDRELRPAVLPRWIVLPIPSSTDWPFLALPEHMTQADWDQMMTVLQKMELSIVTGPPVDD